MNLHRKIEEIRQKPEKERMRYVQVAVFVSMFLIVMIWLMSFTLFRNNNNQPSLLELTGSGKMEELKTQKKSIRDTTDELKSMTNTAQKNIPKTDSEGISSETEAE